MCGIVGFTGKQQAVPVLLQGLTTLEYRGYDSAGVTLQTAKGIETIKTQGRINIRPSGTEALVRVMVEGSDAEKVAEMAEYAKNKVAEVAAKMAQ